MAVDYGIAVNVSSSVSADKKASLMRRIIQILEQHSLSIVTQVWAAGTPTNTYEVNIAVGGATPNFGIEILTDETAFTSDKVATLLREVIQALESESLVLTYTAGYADGDRNYNLSITVT